MEALEFFKARKRMCEATKCRIHMGMHGLQKNWR